MSANIKNTVIIVSLILVTLPFILVTDLFPFMRFGMFAEPIKADIQRETFILTSKSKSGIEKEFNPQEIGIEPHLFFYLTRNYFYRGETEQLILNIEKISSHTEIKEWKLKKVLVKNTSEADTTIVFTKKQ